eukprot:UN24994
MFLLFSYFLDFYSPFCFFFFFSRTFYFDIIFILIFVSLIFRLSSGFWLFRIIRFLLSRSLRVCSRLLSLSRSRDLSRSLSLELLRVRRRLIDSLSRSRLLSYRRSFRYDRESFNLRFDRGGE